MPRVYQQKARADIYARGLRTKNEKNKSGYSLDRSKPADQNDRVIVKKGQSYYTWTLFGGSPQISLTPPKRQQLTSSGFLQSVYDLEDRISSLSGDVDDIKSEVESIIEDIRSLGEEQQEKLDNMPEQLQYALTGELLQGRIDSLDEWANNLESGVDIDFDEPEKEEDETDEEFEERKEQETSEFINSVIEELSSYTYEGE